MVQRAVEEKHILKKRASRDRDSYAKKFEVWGAFDVDEHPKIPEAQDMAKGNGIKLCISNPCFDLWGLLHFIVQDAPIHRHEAQRKLSIEMPSYDPGKGKRFDYELLKSRYETAKARAVILNKRRQEEGIAGGNPSTNVYDLLELIIENGRIIKS